MNRLLKHNVLLKKINNYLYDSELPLNLNYLYNAGSLLGFILVVQIISGFFLASYYVADISLAFESIEYIMREVPQGYIIRYLHANGASLFFVVVYIHIARGLLYGSYTKARISTWYVGVIILLVMIITAFIGYSLVYGQMSYWAIAVITNLLTVIPYFGHDIVEFIYGGFNIGNSTLTRFYALHYILPIIIVALVLAHLITLHNVGGTNPLGISTPNGGKSTKSTNLSFTEGKIKCTSALITFHPYYTIKDLLGIFVLAIVLLFLVFFYPNLLGHTDNYIPANSLVTPAHIQPEFYLLFYYMGLRSIPNKTLGVLVLLSFILVLLFLPFLHKGVINTGKFRPIYRYLLFILFIDFLLGTYLGGTEVAEPYITLARMSSGIYLIFFLVLVPMVSFIESLLFIIIQKQSLKKLRSLRV